MERIIRHKIKKTSINSFALWAIPAVLICCGGPIVLLALISGGAIGFLGILTANVFLVSFGILISFLVAIWFIAKLMSSKKTKRY